MQEALYEGKYFDLQVHLESKLDRKSEIAKLKKSADKGAFLCPYCEETLIVKSGDIRGDHFSHRHSQSCSISAASEVYRNQVKRESKKHSVMKEIIYDELKVQEKITEDLDVSYGFIKKAAEKWRYYPDIIVQNKDKELAITVLTDVTHNKDEKLVKQIKNRNEYFKTKGLEPIWFIENAEQSVDMDNHVIHLWEAELDLAIKTDEDIAWEEALQQLSCKPSLFELFSYHHKKAPASYNVQSLYYVHSTDTNIVFTVQRFIKDEEQYPFRAFVLNKGYQMSLSTALLATQTLQLSHPEVENRQRDAFIEAVKQKEMEYAAQEQEREREKEAQLKALVNVNKPSSSNENERNATQTRRPVSQLHKINASTLLKESDFRSMILDYIRNYDTVSAEEISDYLVQNGASADQYSTGRYKIYAVVCRCLDSLAREGVVELIKKDFVRDRLYSVSHIH